MFPVHCHECKGGTSCIGQFACRVHTLCRWHKAVSTYRDHNRCRQGSHFSRAHEGKESTLSMNSFLLCREDKACGTTCKSRKNCRVGKEHKSCNWLVSCHAHRHCKSCM
mmetsp:Transcript_40888/g.87815  ORF Transcript_40888/g.87815 Transcript_40888/m.87815 type:complete len:109 (+) Transcript_40888:409-735(+)